MMPDPTAAPRPDSTMTNPLFNTNPPFNLENGAEIPDGHVILAEFPNVQWGWEGDMYFWIVRHPSGQVYLGESCHGRLHESNTDALQIQIAELEKYIAATRQGLEMLSNA